MRFSGGWKAAGAAIALAAAAFLALRGTEEGVGTGREPRSSAGDRDDRSTGPAAPAAGAESAAGPAIDGIVVHGAGVPVAGAEVAASREGSAAPVRTVSGPDGRFRIGGLAGDGDWVLGARAPGFAPEVRGGVRPEDGEIRIVLRRPFALSGRVRSPAGVPRAGARVHVLLHVPGLAKPLAGMEVRADEEGDWAFPGLPPVAGEVEATWQDRSSGPRRFDPPAAEGGALAVDLVVDAGPSVAGRVQSEDGRPLAGMQVAAGGPGRAWRRAVTRDDGTFEVSGLDAVPLRLTVRDPERLWREERIEEVLPPRDGLAITLRRDPDAPGRILFRCTDAAGRPVPGVALESSREGAGRPTGLGSAEADGRGQFRTGQLQAGRYRLVLSRGGEAIAVEDVAVEPGRSADLGTLRLAPAATLRGRVVLEGGGPPAEAFVLLGDCPFPEPEAVGHDGALSLRALPPGRGVLRVVHPACEPAIVPWAAGPGETADLGEIRLRPARGAVRGSVRPTGGPIPAGTTVRLRREDVLGRTGLDREATPGPDGRFEFPGVPSGTWRVSAAVPVASSAHARFMAGVAGPEVSLAEGEQREVEVPVAVR